MEPSDPDDDTSKKGGAEPKPGQPKPKKGGKPRPPGGRGENDGVFLQSKCLMNRFDQVSSSYTEVVSATEQHAAWEWATGQLPTLKSLKAQLDGKETNASFGAPQSTVDISTWMAATRKRYSWGEMLKEFLRMPRVEGHVG